MKRVSRLQVTHAAMARSHIRLSGNRWYSALLGASIKGSYVKHHAIEHKYIVAGYL